ncbi:MAG: MaoC family dehydratase [Deltaproteobacteria bacterium]|nr:MaoC family dehydratase [Deltaproteobacteria bacterium]
MSSKAEAALTIFQQRVGQEEGVGEWHTVDQKQIDLFADATLDHQFIHVDPQKAAELSPYKVTIAHGFLTLSMVVHLGASIPRADPAAYAGLTTAINYGLDRVRFPSPVKVNSRIRARRSLVSAELKAPNVIQLKQKVAVEVEGEDKPACVAETLSRLVYG